MQVLYKLLTDEYSR